MDKELAIRLKANGMTVVIKDLSEENLDDHPCFKYLRTTERTVAITKNWLRKVYSKFGACVKVAYIDDKPVAMIQYAPKDIFPHINQPDAHKTILIHCVYIADKKYERKGIGRRLVEALINDLRKPHPYLKGEKFEKIEALAGKGRPGPAGPVEFFVKLGFEVVKQFSKYDVLVRLHL